MRYSQAFCFICVLLLLNTSALSLSKNSKDKDTFTDPEKLIRGLYASVTFEPGTIPDWEYVRKFFIPEAVFGVRQTRTSMEVLSVDEFVTWWESDIKKHKMKERGFKESVEKLKKTDYGNIAQVFVVYKARFMIPKNAPGQLGLDSFSLIKKDGRWWIVSVANDIITPENPLPEDLR
ncbi:MAG: hypothetical protein PVF22_01120 [Candidatus Aminicenantes bacterium]|jgi:hypothetical protein